jgi:hypothetical protein
MTNHRGANRKAKYTFQTQDEWQESAARKGLSGAKATDLFRNKRGDDARIWYIDFKLWMEHRGYDIARQKYIRKYVLAEKKGEK